MTVENISQYINSHFRFMCSSNKRSYFILKKNRVISLFALHNYFEFVFPLFIYAKERKLTSYLYIYSLQGYF